MPKSNSLDIQMGGKKGMEMNPTLFPLKTRFEEYLSENPHVYDAFKHFALQLVAAGRKRIGARMIIERLRWESAVRSNTGEYKLDDHFTPYFVRLFIKEYPQHKDLFRTRKAKADVEV